MEKRVENKSPPDEIILHTDSYLDLFSDFDPRGFSQKALSDDFLLEIKRAAYDKEDPIKLRLLIPTNERDLKSEMVIRKRLNEHFKHHNKDSQQEQKNLMKQGISFILFGVILMITTTFILFKIQEKIWIITFLSVLFEPGGWFLFWEGLHLMIFDSKKQEPNRVFYSKMSQASIIFESY